LNKNSKKKMAVCKSVCRKIKSRELQFWMQQQQSGEPCRKHLDHPADLRSIGQSH
jgi:hypothetical protein